MAERRPIVIVGNEKQELPSSDSLSAAIIADGSVSNSEFQTLNGVTSAIQAQIDSKASEEFAIAMAVAL